MKVPQTIYYHECDKNFHCSLDLELNGNHEIKCPIGSTFRKSENLWHCSYCNHGIPWYEGSYMNHALYYCTEFKGYLESFPVVNK
jgi:hypothetical protein